MKQLLDEQTAIILHTRAYVSRIARLFTFDALAREWGMSRQTLYRYISPEYREVSRDLARIAAKKASKIDTSICYTCHLPLVTHPRCPYCTILTHDKGCDCEERLTAIQKAAYNINI